jgi:uncharacterized protein
MSPAPRRPPSIDAYGGGGFRVSGERREGSLLILDDEPRTWSATSLETLTPADLAPILAADRSTVEFVLLGTGSAQGLPPKAVREALQEARIGLEFMDTANAARLYNVLASEGRRLAAALIAI